MTPFLARWAAPLAAAILALAPGAAAMAAENNPHAMKLSDGGFDLVPVAVPVIVKGQVINYIFVSLRLFPTVLTQTTVLKPKEPFFRDALVRAAHKTPFTLANDYNHVDEARICAAMMVASRSIVGAGQLRAITVSKQQPKNIRRNPAPTAH